MGILFPEFYLSIFTLRCSSVVHMRHTQTYFHMIKYFLKTYNIHYQLTQPTDTPHPPTNTDFSIHLSINFSTDDSPAELKCRIHTFYYCLVLVDIDKTECEGSSYIVKLFNFHSLKMLELS